MEAIDHKNIFNIYSLVPGQDGGLHSSLLGSVVVTGTAQVVLADYHGALASLNGPADDLHRRRFQSWQNSTHARVISHQELIDGKHPDLIPEVKHPVEPDGPEPEHSEWYRIERPDLKAPHIINFRDGQAYMHGQQLSSAELTSLLDVVKQGRGRIRHHRPEEDVMKAEQGFADLVKADKYLHEALSAVKAAQAAGHIEPGILEALHKAIFYDPMVPGVKNKKSFDDEKFEPYQGVHVSLDGNDFGGINKLHGHETGDAAIKAMGGAVRSAADDVMGSGHEDVWRKGGDEFHLRLPSHDHANAFMRNLRQRLEAVPSIGGTHRLSMSAGIGRNALEADQSILHAKAAKKASGSLPGQAETHVHSLVPGHEGHVPLDPEVPVQPAPAPTVGAP